VQAADELPGIPEDNMSTPKANESTEPLVGSRHGAHALMHSEDISYKPLRGEVELCLRVGRMGSIK